MTININDDDVVSFFEIEEKQSLIQRFLSLFNFQKTTKSNIQVNNCNNEFEEFLDDVDESIENYNEVSEVTSLCTESLDILKKQMNFLKRSKENQKILDELTAFDHLEKEDFKEIQKLCERYKFLKQDAITFMNQVSSYSSTISNLSTKEEEALKSVSKIREAEGKREMLEQDIAIIESERYKTYDQFDLMTNALNITKSFSLGMVFMSVIFAFMLAYIQIFKNVSIFYPLLIMVILLMIFITFVYIFRVRTTRELKRNNIKQGRLIALQNKKIAVLASTQSFLNYSYRKYSIKSAKELEENLKEYKKLKKSQNRKDSTKRALDETEELIKEFFQKNKMEMPDEPIEKMHNVLNMENKKRQVENLKNELKRIDKELNVIEKRQGEIWKLIYTHKDNDVSADKVVGEIVKAYHSKAEKLLKKYEN